MMITAMSFTRTEGSLHRIFSCLRIYLAEDLCLFVKPLHLRLHKLGLNFGDLLEIVGLAKFLDERKSSANVLRRTTD
jgi:hypothetical protein